jgi:hypothetical protein
MVQASWILGEDRGARKEEPEEKKPYAVLSEHMIFFIKKHRLSSSSSFQHGRLGRGQEAFNRKG